MKIFYSDRIKKLVYFGTEVVLFSVKMHFDFIFQIHNLLLLLSIYDNNVEI